MSKIDLRGLTFKELEEEIMSLRIEKYRAKQIYKWIYENVNSLDEMTNLPKNMRTSLADVFYFSKLDMEKRQVSKDGTKKYLFRLEDGNAIESVLMSYEHGYSACISTQVGCKMGCKFCASSGVGFNRNLEAGEIVGQIMEIQRKEDIRVASIVFMGIGEPMDNYDNVVKALRILNDTNGLNLGLRHISVSTSGLVPQILKLAKENMPITLSISLHAPNDKIRNEIMPVNKVYNVERLMDACKKYAEQTGRRISFEYIMIKDVNDSRECAIELANLLKGMLAHVNLIQYNKVEGLKWETSPKQNIDNFMQELYKRHIIVTLRRALGNDITAACGQLRRKDMNK